MKTDKKESVKRDDEMLPEYDFSGKKGVRGKYHQMYRRGHTVQVYEKDGSTSIHYFEPRDGAVMLDPDVREYFPDSETVNATLRSLIALIPDGRCVRRIREEPPNGDRDDRSRL